MADVESKEYLALQFRVMVEIEIIQKAWNEWLGFKTEQTKQKEGRRCNVQVERREPWQKPKMRSIELNVCFDIAADGKGEGMGIIAKDGWGEIIQLSQLLWKTYAIQ